MNNKTIKLKVNHLSPSAIGANYINNYLMSLGIKAEDLSSFTNQPRDADEDNPTDLLNIERAVKAAFIKLVDPSTTVFVQVDSDCDGYSSSAILINYLKERFPQVKIKYALHAGKEHGIILDKVPEEANLIFIPDAGSNNFVEQKILVDKGKTVIVLDHHEVHDLENTGAIIVNNQISPLFSNKALSGAGVVYMFIKLMDIIYFQDDPIYRQYLDLAAVGIIADAMNMTTLGNNYIAYHGLRNIRNKFLLQLAVKQERGIKNPQLLTKTDVMFYIAPVINGVIRSGSPEDKIAVFKALTTNDGDIGTIITNWRGVTREENLYEYAVRIAMNAKSRQDNAKKKSFEWLCDKIRKEHLDEHNLLIVPLNAKESMKVSPNITGLIATELVKEFNLPCLVLRETVDEKKQTCFAGSGRNGNFYKLPCLLDYLRDSGFVHYAEGHQSAFGVFIKPDQIDALRNYSNHTIDRASFNQSIYEVDYWFHTGEKINVPMLFDFGLSEDLWGQGLPRPTFAFDFNTNSREIQIMGADKSSVKIKHDGVDFVIFKDPELVAELNSLGDKTFHVQIIGSPSINEWMGCQNVQVMMDSIDITERSMKIEISSLI